MAVHRRAEATWSGTLAEGAGVVTAATSGAFNELPVTWASRTESSEGRTSPEELVAGAPPPRYSMALSGRLTRAGFPPARLDVTSTVTFDKTEAGWRVVSSALTVRGEVPGMDPGAFAAEAEAAKDGCPISNALKGNVALSVESSLA
jgi:osmotically inducible protein OsmC